MTLKVQKELNAILNHYIHLRILIFPPTVSTKTLSNTTVLKKKDKYKKCFLSCKLAYKNDFDHVTLKTEVMLQILLILNCIISQYYCLFCIFNQRNAALVRDFQKP